MPESQKGTIPHRTWLWNASKELLLYYFILVHTLLGKKFSDFVAQRMLEREKQIVMKKSFKVDILPYFAEVVKKSKYVSCNIRFRWLAI